MNKQQDKFIEKIKPFLLPSKNNQQIKNEIIDMLKNIYDSQNDQKNLQIIKKDIEQIWFQVNKNNNQVIYDKFFENNPFQKKQNKNNEMEIEEEDDDEEEQNSQEDENIDEYDENIDDQDNQLDEEEIQDDEDQNQNDKKNKFKEVKKVKSEQQELQEFLNYTDQIDMGKKKKGDYNDLYDNDELEGDEIEYDDEQNEFEDDDDQNQDVQELKNQDDEESEGQNESQDDIENDVFDQQRELELKLQSKKKSKLEKQIDELEDKLVEKKEWQVQGEIKSKQRPVNSLLEANLDFKQGSKVEQQITKEFTENLEKLIKQRCLDEAWDDKIKQGVVQNFQENFNSLQDLNFEKSKIGLAGEYEEQFKTDVLGLNKNSPDEQLKKEIEILFKQLSYTLDNLSNLNFTPKPFIEKMQITPNVPSIQLEEKIPIFISERMQKAPQEIFSVKKDGKFVEKMEMDHDENQKVYRQKRKANHARIQEKKKKQLIKKLDYNGQNKFLHKQIQKADSKINKQVDNKKEQSIKFTKSNQFFANLQEKQLNKEEKKKPIKKQNYKL